MTNKQEPIAMENKNRNDLDSQGIHQRSFVTLSSKYKTLFLSNNNNIYVFNVAVFSAFETNDSKKTLHKIILIKGKQSIFGLFNNFSSSAQK